VRLIVEWLARYGSLLDENGGMDYPNFYKAIIMEMVKPHARLTPAQSDRENSPYPREAHVRFM
jgi:hypothetical protein